MDVEIRALSAGQDAAVIAAGHLFDHPPQPEATRRFLIDPGHHLLVAYDEAERPVGFVSGVETTHPDKGTEMFLTELGVDDPARRQGVGRALVERLVAHARARGCVGVWTATEPDNAAALATYASAGASQGAPTVVFEWGAAGGP